MNSKITILITIKTVSKTYLFSTKTLSIAIATNSAIVLSNTHLTPNPKLITIIIIKITTNNKVTVPAKKTKIIISSSQMVN